MSKTLGIAVPLALVVIAASGAPAAGDGLPLPVDASPSGVVSGSEETRFVTAEAGGRTAVIAQEAGTA